MSFITLHQSQQVRAWMYAAGGQGVVAHSEFLEKKINNPNFKTKKTPIGLVMISFLYPLSPPRPHRRDGNAHRPSRHSTFSNQTFGQGEHINR
jgi:hypothetical protein